MAAEERILWRERSFVGFWEGENFIHIFLLVREKERNGEMERGRDLGEGEKSCEDLNVKNSVSTPTALMHGSALCTQAWQCERVGLSPGLKCSKI